MPYNASVHFDAVADRRGGVRLIPKAAVSRAVSRLKWRDGPVPATRPASASAEIERTVADPEFRRGSVERGRDFLPGQRRARDQSRILGSLPPPEPGMIYRFEEGEDGSVDVIVCEDDGGDFSTVGDAARHSLFPDGTMSKWNKYNRVHWTRDARTRDAVRTMIFRHFPVKGERLELVGPDGNGGFDLVLVTGDTDLVGRVPAGADGEGPTIRSANAPSRTGDNRDLLRLGRPEHEQLAAMNGAAKRFWARR